MARSLGSDIENTAIELRQQGFSLAEIASSLKIAKSTASLWLRHVPLNKFALSRIENKRIIARLKGLKTLKSLLSQKVKIIEIEANKTISVLDLININLCKVLCALLYWGEGSKTGYRTAFTNSDPQMVSTFMTLLRKSYPTDESKFRALVHVHEYHNESQIKNYWSGVTKIPLHQFTKSYLKPHTAKTIRPGYMGTVRISYYDAQIAAQLKAIYNTLAKHLGAW